MANPVVDYLQDAVYHGLAQLLGPENVLEHPRVPRFHEAAEPPDGFAMLNLDVPEAAPRGSLRDMVRWADAIVVGALHDVPLVAFREVLAEKGDKPVAFLDGADDPYVHEIARHVDVYFKREVHLERPRFRTPLPLQRIYFRARVPEFRGRFRACVDVAAADTPGVVPLPFGVIDHGHEPSPEKAYDVAFMGLPTSPQRVRLRSELEKLEADGHRVFAPTERIPWHAYLDVLRRSRIGISLRGAGFDTYRYWEIPYAGSLLLSEPPGIVIPNNFEPDREAVFAPVERMADVARELLAGDPERIACAGHARLHRDHTSVARARTVLAHLRPLAESRGA